LTPEALADLIAKDAARGSEVGDMSSGTGVISEDDIAELVGQLSAHDGTGADQRPDSAAIFAPTAAAQTLDDAISPSVIAQMTAPAASLAAAPTAMVDADELRGARYLMVAAVLLLSLCTVALAFVVSSMNRLTNELGRANDSQVVSGDDFAVDMAVAERWLTTTEAETVTKGVVFLEDELKQRYPRKREVISLRLARHYRDQGAFARAAAEYAAISAATIGLADDPGFYIEYADTLYRIGDEQHACEVLYRLIANERHYRSEVDAGGRIRGVEERERGDAALHRAQLLLGRIYAPDIGVDDQLSALAALVETDS
jgi:hypothetical protein